MPALKVDLDRDILYEVPVEKRPRGGVVIRKDPTTGADVFMYRNDPGVYYSSNGIEVSPALARAAGFDVERLAAEKIKKQKMRDFEAKWNADIQVATRRVVAKRGMFNLVDLGGNRYIVEDIEGQNLTANKQASTLEAGMQWLEWFAGPEVKPDGDVPGPDRPSEVGTDRRASSDGRPRRDVGKSGDQKATVPA